MAINFPFIFSLSFAAVTSDDQPYHVFFFLIVLPEAVLLPPG
jgi:hypothetical protein